jgi:ABC-type Fe3+ transport system permease subunit
MGIPRALILLPLLFLTVFGVAPLVLLLATAFVPGTSMPHGGPLDLLPGGNLYLRLVNSLALAACVASLATAIGILPGVAIGRTDLRLKPAWSIVFSLPLLLPVVFAAAGWSPWAVTWVALLGPAPISRFLGASLVSSLVMFPIPLFLTALSLRRTDGALEDLARLQKGSRRALRSMVFTLARPGITLAWLLVFLIALSETSIPEIFGLATYQARVLAIQRGESWRLAGAASLPLLFAAVAGAAAEARLFGERGVAFLARATRLEARTLGLGRSAWAVQFLLGALALASFGFPLLGWAVALRATGEAAAAAALASAWHVGGPAFARSLIFALAGGTLAAAIALPLAYAAERGALPGRPIVDLLLVLLLVMPGTLLASGLLRIIPGTLFRASALALVVGYAVHVGVVPFRMERVALRRLGTRAEEAGMLAGAPWRMRVERLLLPLNAQYLGGVWAASVLLAFRDGQLAMALSPAAPTLAALAASGAGQSSAALGALSIVTAGLAAGMLLALAALALLLRAALRPSPGLAASAAGSGR